MKSARPRMPFWSTASLPSTLALAFFAASAGAQDRPVTATVSDPTSPPFVKPTFGGVLVKVRVFTHEKDENVDPEGWVVTAVETKELHRRLDAMVVRTVEQSLLLAPYADASLGVRIRLSRAGRPNSEILKPATDMREVEPSIRAGADGPPNDPKVTSELLFYSHGEKGVQADAADVVLGEQTRADLVVGMKAKAKPSGYELTTSLRTTLALKVQATKGDVDVVRRAKTFEVSEGSSVVIPTGLTVQDKESGRRVQQWVSLTPSRPEAARGPEEPARSR